MENFLERRVHKSVADEHLELRPNRIPHQSNQIREGMNAGDKTDYILAIFIVFAFSFGCALFIVAISAKVNKDRRESYLAWQKYEGTERAKQTTYEEFVALSKAGVLQGNK